MIASVVVVLRLELRSQLVHAEAGGDGERAEVVALGGRRNRPERDMACRRHGRPAVAASGTARPALQGRRRRLRRGRASTRTRRAPAASPWTDLVEHLLGVAEELARGRAVHGLSRMAGNLPFELPGVEEEGPVDVPASAARSRARPPSAGEGRLRQVAELELQAPDPRFVDRQERLRRAVECWARSLSCRARLSLSKTGRRSSSSRSDTTPMTRDASSTCTVGPLYAGAMLHRGVLLGGGRAADQQRHLEIAPLHLLGHVRPSRRARA